MKFFMPSKERSDVIQKAIDFIGSEDLMVLVDEIEYDDYKDVVEHPAELVTHPSLYGLGAILKNGLTRNLDQDYVVIVGDDCKGFSYKFHPKVPRFYDTEHFRYVVDNTYQMAKDIGACMFGWANDKGIYFYNHLNPFNFSGFVIGGMQGFIPELLGDVMFDERMIIREDHDICLQVKYYKRYFLMDYRYAIIDITWGNKGGASTLRHSSIYEASNKMLKRKWGSQVVRTNSKKPKQLRLNVPF